MLSEFRIQIEKYNIDKSKRILLAVSGGIDSMVLLDLASKAQLNFAVAHMNYNLRAEESIGDKDLVRKVAEKKNLAFYIKEVDTHSILKTSKKGLQETARYLRYNWFEELIQQEGFDYLFTAHHLNDSVETFFINLNRGTGLKGLLGINNREYILRPLADFTRGDIKGYASINNVEYREDSSNSSEAYFRNWLRHNILKEWQAKNEAFLPRMKKNIEFLKESQDIINNQIKRDLSNVEFNVSQTVDLDKIDAWGAPKFSVFAIIEPFGFTIDQAEEILLKIKERKQGRTFMSADYEILIDREELILSNRSSDTDFEEEVYLEDLPSSMPIGFEMELVNDFNNIDLDAKGLQYLSLDVLEFPLTIRNWREGDRMKPLGMNGNKKISDILIDKKISKIAKAETYVIESASKIACIIGIAIHNDYRITEETTKALRITCPN